MLTLPGQSEPREVRAMEAIEKVARSHEPLWITGEIGTGAAWLAQVIHDATTESGPFQREDCAPGRSPKLIQGRGTLFFCSPERLLPEHQEEILAYLQRTDLRHLEGLRTVTPFPRVMAWSQSGVTALVRGGLVLPALGQALGRMQVAIPPLRAQRESLDAFAQAILEEIASHEGLTVRRLTPDALSALRAYHWPGNLTELHSLLERACLLSPPDQVEIDSDNLPLALQPPLRETPSAGHRPRTMSEIEDEAIRAAIDGNNGNLVRAARELRIGRATLYRKLKKYGIPTRSERRQLIR
jgi:DNA-binding NtrC family response regulator